MVKQRKMILQISLVGVLTALSIALLALLPGIPIMPGASFLKYDAMDIPMIIAGMTLGPVGGAAVLVLGCGIQTLVYGHDGIVGFVMHVVASGVLVMISSLIYRRKQDLVHLFTGLALGTIGMTLIMIPLNLFVTAPYLELLGTPNAYEMTKAMLLPVILPFNLIKAGINSVVTALAVMALRPQISRLQRRFHAGEDRRS